MQQAGVSVALVQQCVVLLGHNGTACFLSGAQCCISRA